MQVKIGDIVHGKISGIQQYGIFVRLDSQGVYAIKRSFE